MQTFSQSPHLRTTAIPDHGARPSLTPPSSWRPPPSPTPPMRKATTDTDNSPWSESLAAQMVPEVSTAAPNDGSDLLSNKWLLLWRLVLLDNLSKSNLLFWLRKDLLYKLSSGYTDVYLKTAASPYERWFLNRCQFSHIKCIFYPKIIRTKIPNLNINLPKSA